MRCARTFERVQVSLRGLVDSPEVLALIENLFAALLIKEFFSTVFRYEISMALAQRNQAH